MMLMQQILHGLRVCFFQNSFPIWVIQSFKLLIFKTQRVLLKNTLLAKGVHFRNTVTLKGVRLKVTVPCKDAPLMITVPIKVHL